MEAKEAKDLTSAAKASKDKKKSDYDKLKEEEKQAIRNKLVESAQLVIDAAIKDIAANKEGTSYALPKMDPIVSGMDDKALDQLIALYTTPGTGNHKFAVTNSAGWLTFDWADAPAGNQAVKA